MLEDYSRVELAFFERDLREAPPQAPSAKAIQQWIEERDAAEPSARARAFIEQHRGTFGALVLLPKMPFPQDTLGAAEHFMMWLLDLQQSHWPAALLLTNGLEIPREYRSDFRKRFVEKAYGACQGPNPSLGQFGPEDSLTGGTARANFWHHDEQS